jgi:hypothetical protein
MQSGEGKESRRFLGPWPRPMKEEEDAGQKNRVNIQARIMTSSVPSVSKQSGGSGGQKCQIKKFLRWD